MEIMKRPAFPAVILSVVLVAAPIPAAARECTDCHEVEKGRPTTKSVHDPYREKDCTSCHEDHGDTPSLALSSQGNELCASCHEFDDDPFLAAHRKLPVKKVPCLSCHVPHLSEKVRLLRPSIHRPLAYGECKDCHREDGQLRSAKISMLCFRCHDVTFFQGTSRHEPVASGDCGECHDPHGSPLPFLLTQAYPAERYVTYGEEAYALCFACHSTEAFTSRGPEADTGFKDNRDNLHYRHVVKQGVSSTGSITREGNTCRNCHAPHASQRPHLIRENLDCGQGVLCLKLGFFKKEGTGTCTAGCHKSASYNSAAAVAEPAPGPAAGQGGSAPTSPCLPCHQKAWEGFQKTTLHDPVRKLQCTTCHLDHGPDNRLLLSAPEGRLCQGCHDLRKEGMTQAHHGLNPAGSRCLSCHDPHAAAEKGLLRPVTHPPFADRACGDCHDSIAGSWKISRPANEVCGDCHDQQLAAIRPHTATLQQGCVGCHNPHAAAREKLLPAPVPELCYRCHDRKNFARPHLHGPVADGSCGDCHDIHGSAREDLLLRTYPLERYESFDPVRNQLCLECHDAGAFTDEDSTDTAFRSESRNLHSLHVMGREVKTDLGTKRVVGATCRNCHDPHSTDQPNLIRQSLDCGGVPCLNLDFKKVGITGRCAKGCHTPSSYTTGQ